ncbi:MAG: inositol monophosphatase [Lachnospiraceae bacterium]|nr:inositol monophosphatase [Lachnospiraceae bacterium]
MDQIVGQIEEIVRRCGEYILNVDRSGGGDIISKEGHANFVTKHDQKVQEILKKELLKLLPGAAFVGEEEEVHESVYREGYAFIVDPIDGTSNFIKDYKASAVSVGLLKDGKQYAGVIYNPYPDEMFSAQAGEGAYLNKKRIHVSDKPLSEGLVIVGTAPYYPELHEESFKMAFHYFKQCIDIRRTGSAAIDLCNVAVGRAELFCELRLQPWDFAAGSLIVTEAGGVVRTKDREELRFDRA